MKTEYDIVVIGGGPSGMMASIKAAEKNVSVCLVEKNHALGRKLLLSGSGRCNLTNNLYDERTFVSHFGKQGSFLFSTIYSFGIEATLQFFRENGVETFKDKNGKIFPASNKSISVLRALEQSLFANCVDICSGFTVKEILIDSGRGFCIKSDKNRVMAKSVILATGGCSFPKTGSTGDGFRLAAGLGHTVVPPVPALSPVCVREHDVASIEGVSFASKGIALFCDRINVYEDFGDIVFTRNGLSGPVIMDMSRRISRLLNEGVVRISIDLLADFTHDELNAELKKMFSSCGAQSIKCFLERYAPERVTKVILRRAEIEGNKKCANITKLERHSLVAGLKGMYFTVSHVEGFDKAYATDGGIKLKEIDSRTMQSKIINGLFFCGEVIDLVGPCGGFNLQLAWTTGAVAGQSAADFCRGNV